MTKSLPSENILFSDFALVMYVVQSTCYIYFDIILNTWVRVKSMLKVQVELNIFWLVSKYMYTKCKCIKTKNEKWLYLINLVTYLYNNNVMIIICDHNMCTWHFINLNLKIWMSNLFTTWHYNAFSLFIFIFFLFFFYESQWCYTYFYVEQIYIQQIST